MSRIIRPKMGGIENTDHGLPSPANALASARAIAAALRGDRGGGSTASAHPRSFRELAWASLRTEFASIASTSKRLRMAFSFSSSRRSCALGWFATTVLATSSRNGAMALTSRVPSGVSSRRRRSCWYVSTRVRPNLFSSLWIHCPSPGMLIASSRLASL